MRAARLFGSCSRARRARCVATYLADLDRPQRTPPTAAMWHWRQAALRRLRSSQPRAWSVCRECDFSGRARHGRTSGDPGRVRPHPPLTGAPTSSGRETVPDVCPDVSSTNSGNTTWVSGMLIAPLLVCVCLVGERVWHVCVCVPGQSFFSRDTTQSSKISIRQHWRDDAYF